MLALDNDDLSRDSSEINQAAPRLRAIEKLNISSSCSGGHFNSRTSVDGVLVHSSELVSDGFLCHCLRVTRDSLFFNIYCSHEMSSSIYGHKYMIGYAKSISDRCSNSLSKSFNFQT